MGSVLGRKRRDDGWNYGREMADHAMLFMAAVLVLIDDHAAVARIYDVVEMLSLEERRGGPLDRGIVAAWVIQSEMTDINA